MMEIVFGESACGSLKLAQSYGKGAYRGGAIGVFLHHADGSPASQEEIEQARRKAEEDARRAWVEAVPLGGSSGDVFCIDLNLSEGDISEDFPGEKRRAEMERKMRTLGDSHLVGIVEENIRRAGETLGEARKRLLDGGEIRVWYSAHNPDEFCGFCWLMARLQDIPSGSVRAVCLPTHVEKENSVLSHSGWGDVALEEWHRLVRHERTLSPLMRSVHASCWRQLQVENASLRAVVNGRLTSVPEGFYDGFIRREIAAQDEKFHEARVIGSVLGKYSLSIGDGFIALRIEKMLQGGEIEAVTQPEAGDIIYRRWLRKTGKFSQNT